MGTVASESRYIAHLSQTDPLYDQISFHVNPLAIIWAAGCAFSITWVLLRGGGRSIGNTASRPCFHLLCPLESTHSSLMPWQLFNSNYHINHFWGEDTAGGEVGLWVYDPSHLKSHRLILYKDEHLAHQQCAGKANIQPDLSHVGVLSLDLICSWGLKLCFIFGCNCLL